MKILLLFAIALFFLVGCEKIDNMENAKALEPTVITTIPSETMHTEEMPETETPVILEEPVLLTQLINPEDSDFVRVTDYIPDVFVELKYSTSDNFTGQIIYEFEDVFLRYRTVMKLKAVSEELRQQGLYLKIWDGFRPVSAQFKLWEICPDPTFVANPNKGFSNHSRGFAVDLTLADSQGREVEMPTCFDDFSARADRDYSDCTQTQAENARLLEGIMEKHGFSGYWGEWWHFNDTQKYDVETCFDPSVITWRNTTEKTPLLETSSETSEEILTIPAGAVVTLLGYDEAFAMVEYWGYRGFVATESIRSGE